MYANKTISSKVILSFHIVQTCNLKLFRLQSIVTSSTVRGTIERKSKSKTVTSNIVKLYKNERFETGQNKGAAEAIKSSERQ